MKYIEEFIKIKNLTENYWSKIKLDKKNDEFQIQNGTKWKKGLSENEICDFERDMGFEFPEILRDYYTVMNGVDKTQINVYEDSGESCKYSQNIYGYPNDIERIKFLIKWIYGENRITETDIKNKNISRIFPIYYNKFMLIDHEEHPILSMYNNDIIIWTKDIIDLYKKEIGIKGIENIKNMKINYWLNIWDKK